MLFLIIPAVASAYIIPAAIVGAATLIGNGINAFSNWRNNSRNIRSQENANATNLAFAREQFNYEKMLNENQFQMNVADMEKAGINPMAAFSPSVTSGSYQSSQVGSQSVASQFDLSPISELASGILQSDTQKRIATSNNDTQKAIATSNNDTQKAIAEKQAEIQSKKVEADIKNQSELLILEKNKAKAESARQDALTRARIAETNRGSQQKLSNFIKNRSDMYDLYTKLRDDRTPDGSSMAHGFDLNILKQNLRIIGSNLGFNENFDFKSLTFPQFEELMKELVGSESDLDFIPYTW